MHTHRRPNIAWRPAGILASLIVLCAGCSKQPEAKVEPPRPASVPLVAESEQSRHFEAVNKHLELGGTLYGYADVDGDILSLAGNAQALARNIAAMQPQYSMFAKQDFKVLMTDLGLDDVKAVGLSSVRRADGLYRNRAFLYTPAGRHGVFAVFGGKPAPFTNAKLAPVDADVFAEHELDLTAIYDTIKGVISKVDGPEAAESFEKQVRKAGSEAHFSLFDLIEGLNGRATFILHVDPTRTLTVPGASGVQIPVFSALIKVDGIGSALEDLLSSDPKVLAPSTEGTLHVFTCAGPAPMEGMKYVLAVDGRSLYIATSDNFLHECLDRKAGLDTNPDFTAALADLGPEGNGLTWVSPRFFTRLRQLPDMNPQASKEARQLLELYSSSIPASSQPILLVRTNLPDGILLRSTWNRSLKADLAMLTVYNPVTVGLLAAMAIPAFQKVRANSQAVAVTNNLRMLAAAADQYYLEHGATSATYDDLVGPDKYVKSVTPVAGEDYRSLKFVQGRPLRILLADGRVISYPRGGPHKMVTPPGAYPNLNTVPNFESPPITPPSKY